MPFTMTNDDLHKAIADTFSQLRTCPEDSPERTEAFQHLQNLRRIQMLRAQAHQISGPPAPTVVPPVECETDAPPVPILTHSVLDEIATERVRQIDGEGFDYDYDDQYKHGELAAAGVSYGVSAVRQLETNWPYPEGVTPPEWPWDALTFKPKNPRRDLIRGAALYVAAIEWIDRNTDAVKVPE